MLNLPHKELSSVTIYLAPILISTFEPSPVPPRRYSIMLSFSSGNKKERLRIDSLFAGPVNSEPIRTLRDAILRREPPCRPKYTLMTFHSHIHPLIRFFRVIRIFQRLIPIENFYRWKFFIQSNFFRIFPVETNLDNISIIVFLNFQFLIFAQRRVLYFFQIRN